MRLATIRTDTGTGAAETGRPETSAVRIDNDAAATDLGCASLEELFATDGWPDRVAVAGGESVSLEQVSYAPVTRPSKIVCVGLNYRSHILEMGRELPQYPTLFAKYAESLVGAKDNIMLPPESDAVDWEAEMAIIIGARVRRASEEQATAAIAGFSVLNDVTMRDWQYRSTMWLQGKTWEHATPFGPWLVTPDELPGGVRPSLHLTGRVNDEVVQSSNTDDLVFDPVALVRYISTMVTLQPGDVIASGTPGGVGHARKPPRYLTVGDVLITEVDGIGVCRNTVVAEAL